MSNERPKDQIRRRLIKLGVFIGLVAATGGVTEVAKRLLEPKMSPDEFVKDFDQIFSLLPMFEGAEIPYASYTRTKAYEFKSSKVYTLWKKESERSLRISDRPVQLRADGTSDNENYLRIYQISSVKIVKTYDGPNDGSPNIAELLNEKEVLLLSLELQRAFLGWAQLAPQKQPIPVIPVIPKPGNRLV